MSTKITPLMQQYFDIRPQYPDMVLLFQVGDFYELFFEDARRVSSFLGITLTKRGNHKGEPIPLCGIPVHTKHHYIAKLVKGGFHVALCDQLEEAKPGTIVKRGVTKVFTPATLTDDMLLDEKSSSYLFSFFPLHDCWGLLFGELLTAQLFATTVSAQSFAMLECELGRFTPDEILLPKLAASQPFYSFFKKRGYPITQRSEEEASPEDMHRWIENNFGKPIESYVAKNIALKQSLYNFYGYMRFYHQAALEEFRTLQIYEPEDFLILDSSTQRNLEIVKNNYDGSSKHTLFSIMDNAVTSMGSRTIKKWLLRPLINQEAIQERLDIVHTYLKHISWLSQIKEQLQVIGDLERVVGRIALKRATCSDYLLLLKAVRHVPIIKQILLMHISVKGIQRLYENIDDVTLLQQLLERALNDDTSKDWIIKTGFHEELDSMRTLAEQSSHHILLFEAKEQQRTGIASLKVRYNYLQGYYIEITPSYKNRIPSDYIHRQSLAGKIRYTLPELQTLEQAIADARSTINSLEHDIFASIQESVRRQITQLRKLTHALSALDALLGFAQTAYHNNYIQPVIHDSADIIIEHGRHPVIECFTDRFVPNNTQLTQEQSLWIITGPNMGGKSTYLRQVASICLLAQCGSFVPARTAHVPILDRIFTRIGASDKLAEGKSTFLVEMEETAAICNYATARSLVILDEVGRGTSTFDGLAIAQAVVEFLYNVVRARALFATHYHELSNLNQTYPHIVNYHAASTKTENGVVFLYQIMAGKSDRSFGVEVAKLAHMPLNIIQRAEYILRALEQNELRSDVSESVSSDNQLLCQNIKLKQQLEELTTIMRCFQNINYEQLSPKQAFDMLWSWKDSFSPMHDQ